MKFEPLKGVTRRLEDSAGGSMNNSAVGTEEMGYEELPAVWDGIE